MPENFEYYIKNFLWVCVETAANWFRYITDIKPEVKRAAFRSFNTLGILLINLDPFDSSFQQHIY